MLGSAPRPRGRVTTGLRRDADSTAWSGLERGRRPRPPPLLREGNRMGNVRQGFLRSLHQARACRRNLTQNLSTTVFSRAIPGPVDRAEALCCISPFPSAQTQGKLKHPPAIGCELTSHRVCPPPVFARPLPSFSAPSRARVAFRPRGLRSRSINAPNPASVLSGCTSTRQCPP